MPATLHLEIVTPSGSTCSEEVEMVTLPGVEGEMGIYPNHVPLVTQLVPGEIAVRVQGQERYLAIGPGFAEITGDHVHVLTDMAITADEVDEAAADSARKAAESRLRERLGDEDAVAVNAALLRSIQHLRGRARQRKPGAR
jgi:F-type H+-transporting ATPase subunit epsilon